MKNFTFCVLFLSFISNVYSQDWTYINPFPSEFFYSNIHIDETGVGVLVGSNGIITTTTDFGASFKNILSWTTQRLNSVDKIKDGVYIAVGNNGVILRSSDVGESWETILSPLNQILRKVLFINETTGFIVGANGLVMKSQNGGLIWEEVEINTTLSISGINFINDLIGYIWSEEYNNYFITLDGGDSWDEISTGYSQNISGLNFSDSENGRIFLFQGSYKGLVLETSDGGLTWDEITDNTPGFTALSFIDENIGFGYNVSHGFFKTSNGGISWSEIGYRVHDVKIIGTNTIYTLGESGISKSENLGNSWVSLSSKLPVNGFKKVIFVGETEVYAVGNSAGIYKSIDRGLTFEKLGINYHTTLPIVDIVSLGNNRLIAVGAGSRVLTSMDGGKTWHIEVFQMANFVAIDRMENTVRVISSAGELLQSNDLGLTWEVKNTGISNVSNIKFSSPLIGFIKPQNIGGFYRTLDGGITWDVINEIQPAFCTDCMYFLDENIGYVLGNSMYKTLDGGITWESYTSEKIPITFQRRTLYFRDENVGYLVGTRGGIFKTTDGGRTWEKQFTFTQDDFISVVFNNEGIGITVGEKQGVILRIEEGSLSSSQVEEVMKLPNMVIFPNPAVQEIHLPSDNFTDRSVLNIYGINGNLISEIKGNLQGQPINVSHLPAGTYILLHSNGVILEKGVFVKQ